MSLPVAKGQFETLICRDEGVTGAWLVLGPADGQQYL